MCRSFVGLTFPVLFLITADLKVNLVKTDARRGDKKAREPQNNLVFKTPITYDRACAVIVKGQTE